MSSPQVPAHTDIVITFDSKPLPFRLHSGDNDCNAYIESIDSTHKSVADGLALGLYVQQVDEFVVVNKPFVSIENLITHCPVPMRVGFNKHSPTEHQPQILSPNKPDQETQNAKTTDEEQPTAAQVVELQMESPSEVHLEGVGENDIEILVTQTSIESIAPQPQPQQVVVVHVYDGNASIYHNEMIQNGGNKLRSALVTMWAIALGVICAVVGLALFLIHVIITFGPSEFGDTPDNHIADWLLYFFLPGLVICAPIVCILLALRRKNEKYHYAASICSTGWAALNVVAILILTTSIDGLAAFLLYALFFVLGVYFAAIWIVSFTLVRKIAKVRKKEQTIALAQQF